MTTSTIADLLSQAQAAGLTFALKSGQVAVRFPKDKPPSPVLLAALRERKEDIQRALAHSPGWGNVPDGELPLVTTPDRLRPKEIEWLVNHLFRQGQAAVEWMLQQATRYTSACPGWNSCQTEMNPCLDLLLWQRSH